MDTEESQQSAQTTTGETGDKTLVDLSGDESDYSEDKKSIQEGTRRYPQCTRKSPTWFKINAMAIPYPVEESSVREALLGAESKLWQEALSKEVRILEDLKCWKVLPHPTYEKVVHMKFVLKRKEEEQGNVRKQKVRLAVCGNEKLSRGNVFHGCAPLHHQTDFLFIRSKGMDVEAFIF